MRTILITFLMLVPNYIFAQFSGNGSGTSDDPYQITNAGELFEVRNDLSASYKMMNDVDLTEWIEENNPQSGWGPINNFSGDFDGNGKRIYGLYINRPTENHIGLFGVLGAGVIHNIQIQHADITGNTEVGVIAGTCLENNAIFDNTIINSKVTGNDRIGGIVGRALSVSKNSVININIRGNSCIGGVVGYASEFAVASGYYRGKDSQITQNIVIRGSILGEQYVGGIMGFIGGRTENQKYPGKMVNTISANYCSVQIKADKYAGGICGYAPSSYYFQNVSGTTYGEYSSKLKLTDNSFEGRITGKDYIGGIIGYVYKDGSTKQSRIQYVIATNNVAVGTIEGVDDTNGIVGRADCSSAPSSYKNDLSHNVCIVDTISNTQGIPFRLWNYIEHQENASIANYALSQTLLLSKGSVISIDEGYNNGMGIGKTLLHKKTTYEGFGFDFSNNWAIVEGETYPYNINQCRPATVTSFKSGTSGTIEGTAIGKSSQCNGNVYVFIGDYFYEGTVTNGQWRVLLGEVKVGAVAKVTVMVDGMMPSILTTAIAEKGSSTTPVVDNTPDTDISALSDVVYINNVEASVGTQLTLSVKMKNAVTAEGFGFDLYLPDGVTVARDEEGFPMVELSTERTTSRKTNSFDAAFQSDGSLRVLAASTNGSAINGNDGEVCLITINIDNDMIEGDYPILLKNIAISDVDAVSHRTEQVKSTLTISAYTPGDANNDGVIDVSDFTATAHYLLGNAPTGFNVKAGDANGDSVVDVADLTAVAHIILYGSVNRPSSARAFEMNEPQ